MADSLFDMWNMESLESEKIGEDNDNPTPEEPQEKGFKEIDPNGAVIEDDDIIDPEPEPEEDPVFEPEDEPLDDEFSFTPLVNDLRDNDVLLLDDEDLEDFDGKDIGKFRELVEKSVDKKLKTKLDSIDPLAAKVIELAEKGAPIEQAFETINSLTDFQTLDFSDRDNQVGLISDHLAALGLTEEEIEEKITDLDDLGKLEKEAKIAARFLEKRQNERLAQYEEQVQKSRLKEQEEYEAEVKEVKQTIDTMDEIAGFKLTKAERAAFKDYLFKPVTKDGLTQADIDNSLENRLKKEFMNFKKFNFEKIEKKAKSKVAKEVYKSVSNYVDPNASGRSDYNNRQAKEGSTIINLPWLG